MTSNEAITLLRTLEDKLDSYCELNEEGKTAFRMAIEALSSSEIPNSSDTISRQAAIDTLNGIINRFEQILRDIRESKVDDSVCGMCEYDGAFVGQSGDWCNECPGFEKDDCFKLSDDCRKRWLKEANLPSVQPERKKDVIQKFHDYQIEWLTSHCDLELEPVLESWIVRFLHDTANCYMMEVEHEAKKDG